MMLGEVPVFWINEAFLLCLISTSSKHLFFLGQIETSEKNYQNIFY